MRTTLFTLALTFSATLAALGCGGEAVTTDANEGEAALAASGSATVKRPIEEFLSAQGTFCSGGPCLIVPPVPNFLGFNEDAVRVASIDYAGLANAYLESASGGAVSLGTSFSGSVIERPLADGQAEVTVLLHTRNALTWVPTTVRFNSTDPLLFGARVQDVLAGARPALADSTMQIVFVNTAPGAPLPDLEQLIFAPEPGQALERLTFRATAKGELHATFGVPEGTPGMLQTTQVGLVSSSAPGIIAHNAFPVEHIDLHAIGNLPK